MLNKIIFIYQNLLYIKICFYLCNKNLLKIMFYYIVMLIELNKDQEIAYNLICSGLNIFITGGGGVGKSALIDYYINT